jgi:cytidylate kinase
MKLLKLLKESIGLHEGVYDPGILKVFFLAGGPGSGKSFVSGKVTSGMPLKFINSDIYFEQLLKKANLSMDLPSLSDPDYKKAMDFRAAAKTKARKTEANYLEGRLGVIFDGTGDDFAKIKGLKDKCEALGYDTYMLFVNTSLDVALQRNAQRERTVRPDIVADSWRDVQSNIGKFQNLFGTSNMIVVDNDVFNEDVLNKVWKRIKNLMDAPIKNPIGKKWIKDELEARKR